MTLPKPHMTTLLYAAVIVVLAIVVYHFVVK